MGVPASHGPRRHGRRRLLPRAGVRGGRPAARGHPGGARRRSRRDHHGLPPLNRSAGAWQGDGMADPAPGTSRDARRERLVALLLLGVAVVLLVSSVTWFGTGQSGVGVGQVVLGLLLIGVGGFLYRRSSRA